MKVKGKNCPWLTKGLKKLMNERDYFLKKARKSGNEIDWSAYRRLRNQIAKKIIKVYKRKVLSEYAIGIS